jgi:hypothetical protein
MVKISGAGVDTRIVPSAEDRDRMAFTSEAGNGSAVVLRSVIAHPARITVQERRSNMAKNAFIRAAFKDTHGWAILESIEGYPAITRSCESL